MKSSKYCIAGTIIIFTVKKIKHTLMWPQTLRDMKKKKSQFVSSKISERFTKTLPKFSHSTSINKTNETQKMIFTTKLVHRGCNNITHWVFQHHQCSGIIRLIITLLFKSWIKQFFVCFLNGPDYRQPALWAEQPSLLRKIQTKLTFRQAAVNHDCL